MQLRSKNSFVDNTYEDKLYDSSSDSGDARNFLEDTTPNMVTSLFNATNNTLLQNGLLKKLDFILINLLQRKTTPIEEIKENQKIDELFDVLNLNKSEGFDYLEKNVIDQKKQVEELKSLVKYQEGLLQNLQNEREKLIEEKTSNDDIVKFFKENKDKFNTLISNQENRKDDINNNYFPESNQSSETSENKNNFGNITENSNMTKSITQNESNETRHANSNDNNPPSQSLDVDPEIELSNFTNEPLQYNASPLKNNETNSIYVSNGLRPLMNRNESKSDDNPYLKNEANSFSYVLKDRIDKLTIDFNCLDKGKNIIRLCFIPEEPHNFFDPVIKKQH